MKKLLTLTALLCGLLPLRSIADTLDPVPPQPFIENLGQVINTDNELESGIQYYTDVQGYRSYFSPGLVSDVWHTRDTANDMDTVYRMDMEFTNYEHDMTFHEGQTIDGQLNYLLGYLPEMVSGVSQYDGITYTGVYKHIDCVVSNNSWSVNYDFDIASTGSSSDIIMNFTGATDLVIGEKGDLTVTTDFGEVFYDAPTAYYMDGTREIPVDVEYSQSETTITFVVGEEANEQHVFIHMGRMAYPPSTAFVTTTQQQLYWATYFGTSGGSEMHDSYLDEYGDLYIAGGGAAGIFPASNSLALTFAGGWDAIVAKFGAGRQLDYATWIGGSNYDEAWNITSSSHHPCFTGPTTSTDFPLTTNAVQTAPGNNSSAMYVKLDDDNYGGDLLISTYLGFNNYIGGAFGIASDISGNIYIGTNSFQDSSVPLVNLSGAYYQSTTGGSFDGYLAEFNTSNVQIWGTYIGGSGWDQITSLAVDANNKLYMLGWSTSPTQTQNCSSGCTSNSNTAYFPVADPQNSVSYQQQMAASSQRDAFVGVFNSAHKLAWSTMLGGTDDEGYCEGHDGGIVVDAESGAFYVATSSRSSDFPIVPSTQPSNTDVYWQDTPAGGLNDAVIVKFNPSYHMVYSTYYGGDGDDLGSDIAVTYSSALHRVLIYMSGGIFSSGYTTFPTLSQTGYLNISPNGNGQAYIAMFDDDPDDFDALPERDWASCIGACGNWFVSAQDERLVAGGWCQTDIDPAPVSDPDPPSFIEPTRLAYSNGYILEFVFCNSCRFAQPMNTNHVTNLSDVYPNPSEDGKFILNIPDDMKDQMVNISVIDMMGKTIYSATSTGESPLTIDLSSQPAGVYSLRITSGEESKILRIIQSR